jgi:hypothetical protein
VLAPAYLLILPDFENNSGLSLMGKFKKTDWLGAIVLMGGSAFIIMAMNFGGSVFAWDSSEEIAFWVMTGVFLILMALVTKFHPFVSKENKLYPSHFLRQFELVNLQIQIFMVSGLMFVSTKSSAFTFTMGSPVKALTYYLPLFFQFTKVDLGNSFLRML